jgi:hypothetical protein
MRTIYVTAHSALTAGAAESAHNITRLKISSVLTRVQKAISIGTQGSKRNVLLLAGKACNKLPAYGRKKACNPAGLLPVIKTVIFLQGCRARLNGKGAICAVWTLVTCHCR